MDRDLNESILEQVKDIIRPAAIVEMRADVRVEMMTEIHEELKQIRQMMASIVSEFSASVQQVLEETMTMFKSIQEMITSAQSMSAPKEEAEQNVEEGELC